MKILFSEAPPDYAGYVFPYAVWGFLEPGETVADALAQGFLPSLPDLSRFYLCRQVRVDLAKFRPSSENRRILRKGEGIDCTIVERSAFDWTDARRAFCLEYATRRWSTSPSCDRIDRIFSNPITTHVAVFRDASGREVGLVSLLRDDRSWFYSNAFYDAGHPLASLGAYLMTETVRQISERGESYLHLGTCYSRSALYKTQFPGVEFFNGTRWSDDLAELKHLIDRQEKETPGHLLEEEPYRERWVPEGIAKLAQTHGRSLRDR
ncbi:MAG: hypothetical protein AAB214_13830 [Fibrobacterota bacterium]